MNPSASGQKILFVDDERRILDALKRQFHNRFEIDTACGPEEGLALLAAHGPYAVIVSDLTMPGMNGIEFLSEARRVTPDSVRVMLTGHADTNAAIAAINQGAIFRFLTKPCFGEVLARTIQDSLDQYRLITSERLLLEETLHGAIRVLTEMLSLLNPAVFSQTARIRATVRGIVDRLQRPDAWRYDVAAMLSHVGCITVPPAILSKVAAGETLSEEETRIFAAHPQIGQKLLGKIPRLEDVAEMIGRQHELCPDSGELLTDDTLAGARMLKAAIDADHLHMSGLSHTDALARMRDRGIYHARILDALADLDERQILTAPMEMYVDDLRPGMIVDQEVIAPNGLLLLARGQEVTEHVIARLQCFRATQGVVEPFRAHPAS